MPRILSALIGLMLCAPALALTGNAPPAAGYAARAIVMVVDPRGDLCTGTALTHDLVLTAAHCVARKLDYQVKTFQPGTDDIRAHDRATSALRSRELRREPRHRRRRACQARRAACPTW